MHCPSSRVESLLRRLASGDLPDVALVVRSPGVYECLYDPVRDPRPRGCSLGVGHADGVVELLVALGARGDTHDQGIPFRVCSVGPVHLAAICCDSDLETDARLSFTRHARKLEGIAHDLAWSCVELPRLCHAAS